MSSLLNVLIRLTPYEIDRAKVRVGPEGDGGYVMAEGLRPEQTILSYGISTEYRFDEELAKRGHTVFMFDHTIDGIEQTSKNQRYYKEGVAGITDETQLLYSIEDHLAKYDIQGSDLILKMDVEGAEYESLLACSAETLGRFEQIILEVHKLGRLGEYRFRRRFNRFFRKLNEQFTIFHVHGNNYRGYDGLVIVEGVTVSNILELSLIRRDLVKRSPNRTIYPTPLDYRNCNHPELPLYFYPFIPTTVGKGDFRKVNRALRARDIEERLETLDRERNALEAELAKLSES